MHLNANIQLGNCLGLCCKAEIVERINYRSFAKAHVEQAKNIRAAQMKTNEAMLLFKLKMTD